MAAISPITLVFNAVDQATPVLRNLVGQVKEQFGIVTSLSFAYNQVTQSFQMLAAQGRKAYDLLIGQNVKLQEELLGTKASLVATNKVLENGLQIKDPTKAINALTEPVNAAIKSLREGSLELVGVTSSQLVPIYQLVAQNAGAVGINLQQASDLTLDFAASLGTLGVPLYQAREEVNSILNGTITYNSRVAKSLGITNSMVNSWKAQGVLVDRLTEKLSAFRAGNALAAQTLNGVSSNIQEIIEEITRVAGEPLLAPIVSQLDNIYKFLQQNRVAIGELAQNIVNFFITIGTKLGEALAILSPVIKTLAESLFTQITAEGEAAAKVITLLVEQFVILVKVSEPLLAILTNIVKVFADLSSTDIGGLIIQTTLLVAIMGKLAVGLISIVAIQIIPFLITLVPKFIAVAEAAKLFWVAASGNQGALTALNLLIPALGKLAAAYVAAGGGVKGFIAASAALLSIPAALAAITVGLTAVATAAALAWRNQQRLADAGEALETFRQVNDQILDQSLKTAQGLQAINQAEKDNGTITKEQAKERERLQKLAKNQVGQLQDQLKALKELQTENPSQKNAQQAQIKLLEQYIALLNRQSGGVQLASVDLRELGNDYEQLSKKVENAVSQFQRPVNEEVFKQSAKDIIDFTNKQLQAGQITSAQAVKQLEQVRNDTRVELEIRLQAQEAITKARQVAVDRTVQTLTTQQEAIERLVAGEIISQVEGQKQITYNKILQLKEQLKATRQSIAEETKLRNEQINQQIKGIDKQIEEAEKRRADAEKAGNKQNARLANEDIARLESQKAAAQQSLKIDSERLQDLKKQESNFKTQLDKTVVQQRTEQRQQRLKDFDEQSSLLEAANAQRLITQEQFSERSLQIARNKAQEELRVLDEQEKKLRPGREGKDGREEIAAKRAVIQKKLAEDIEKFEAEKAQIRLSNLDAEQKQTAAKLSEGQITEEQFYKESFENTKKRLQAELDEINRQRARLKPGDSRLATLDGQSADIRKKQLDNFADFQQNQLKVLEIAQKRARDVVSQSEQDRLNEITRLEADKTITSAKANELRVNNSRETIEEELKLEQEKLDKLLSLPPFSDPTKEEQRQVQIRASRLKTSQITKQLIDNEVAQREAAFKVIEDQIRKRIQQLNNETTAQTQQIEQQVKLSDFAAKNLSIQKELISSRQSLVQSEAGYLQSQLNILSQITNDEQKKKKLAESSAEIRLKAVIEQAVYEQKILEINLQQIQAALEHERIQLRIEALKARAATLTAQAEEEIVNKDPNASVRDKEAARLRTQAAILSESLLGEQEKLLDTKEFANRRQAEVSRIETRNKNQLAVDQARLELANSRRDQSLGRRERDALDREIRARGINEDLGRNLRFIRRETAFEKDTFNPDGTLRDKQQEQRITRHIEQVRQTLAEALGLQLDTPPPPITTQGINSATPPQVPTTVQKAPVPQSQFTGNITPIQTSDRATVPATGNFTFNITNSFAPGDIQSGEASKKLTEQIQNEMYTIFQMANRR